MQTSSRFQELWVSSHGWLPGLGVPSVGQRLGLSSTVLTNMVHLVCGVACSWSNVLGVGEPQPWRRVLSEICSTPCGLDPNAPTRPGRPPWPEHGGVGAFHQSPGPAGRTPKLCSCLSTLAEPGLVVKGSASREDTGAKQSTFAPSGNPAQGGKGGEQRSDPAPLAAAALTGQAWKLWLPGSLRPMAPCSPGGNGVGGGQREHVGRQLHQHGPETNSKGPHPPQAPLPPSVPRERLPGL